MVNKMKKSVTCVRHPQYFREYCPLCKVSKEDLQKLFDKTIDDLGLNEALAEGKEYEREKRREWRRKYYQQYKERLRGFVFKYNYSKGVRCYDCKIVITNNAKRCKPCSQAHRHRVRREALK